MTTPLVLPLAPSEVQTIRWSGICSWTVAFQLRVEKAILAVQSEVTSSWGLTLWTPLVKPLKSWNCVHWS
ncbi:hypothetical protein SROCM77S_06309 [Streptomyces rochei]